MPHNDIGELEAWMYFLGSDDPIHIRRILEKYPFFKELYQEIINFRHHPKELITMFSEALAIMDRNTINLMIDDMKKVIAEKDNVIAEQAAENAALIAEINLLRSQLNKQ